MRKKGNSVHQHHHNISNYLLTNLNVLRWSFHSGCHMFCSKNWFSWFWHSNINWIQLKCYTFNCIVFYEHQQRKVATSEWITFNWFDCEWSMSLNWIRMLFCLLWDKGETLTLENTTCKISSFNSDCYRVSKHSIQHLRLSFNPAHV